jgi:hypothetical protein
MKIEIKNQLSYHIAIKVTYNYFYQNQMDVLGAKIVGNYLYVVGGNEGFPDTREYATRAYVKVNMITEQIIDYYTNNCPVYVEEFVFQ